MAVELDPRTFDLQSSIEQTHAFIQWKGTDACLDFYCECGTHHHIDGAFLYAIQCHVCEAIWQMPSNLFPRRIERADGVVHRTSEAEEL